MTKGTSMAGKARKPMMAESLEQKKARFQAGLALRPDVNAAAVLLDYSTAFGKQEIEGLIERLSDSVKQVQDGDMKGCEAMLTAQAYALQSIFVNFSRRAFGQGYLKNQELFIRMAMRAQNQCRMTLETLATIKNPPVVFARQANVTTGPQQINNGAAAPSRARETENAQTQLSGKTHELLPDARTSGDAFRVDSTLEALGKIDRAEVRRG
jgi:hypothetical protein